MVDLFSYSIPMLWLWPVLLGAFLYIAPAFRGVNDMTEGLAFIVFALGSNPVQNPIVIIVAALAIAVVIIVTSLFLFRSSGKKKGAKASKQVGASDWQRQPGATAWGAQTPAEQPQSAWGAQTPAKQSGSWGTPTPAKQSQSAWGAQTPAGQPQSGSWGAPAPAEQPQPGSWGMPTPSKQSASAWGAQTPAEQPGSWGAQTPAEQPGSWGAQTPAEQPASPWGTPTPAKQPGSWGTPTPVEQAKSGWGTPTPAKQPQSAWGAQTPAEQPGSWGMPTPSKQSASAWGTPTAAEQPQSAWGAQTPAEQSQSAWGIQTPERWTEVQGSIVGPKMEEKLTYRIFVSHSSKDDDFGVRLAEDLRRVLDTGAVWYDSRGGLNPGDRWFRRIEEELVGRNVFLIIISQHSMDSDWVRREFDIALNEKKRIVPVLYQPCTIWPYLRTVHYVSFLPPKSYGVAFDELLRALSMEKSG